MWNDRIEQTEELRRRHYLGGGQVRIDRQHGDESPRRWSGFSIC